MEIVAWPDIDCRIPEWMEHIPAKNKLHDFM